MLLGASRDKVPAYASTMCGDELPGGLATPEDYAAFALKCRERGYTAFKLHTWMPPIAWARPSATWPPAARSPRRSAMRLMLDSFHYYGREEALYIGRELEKLGYYWLEEPMDEHSTSSYIWLANQLDIRSAGRRPPRARCRPAPSGSCAARRTSAAAACGMSAG